MRRAVAVLLFVAACGDGDPEPKEPRPPTPPPIPPPVKWVKTQAPNFDLEISVPEAWSSHYKVLQDEIHFGGPGVPGSKPELIFGWTMGVRAPGSTFSKFENSPGYRVLDRRTTTVAGMPGASCIFETAQVRQILFEFAGHGGHGFVRGVAPIPDFGRYGPIFEEAARRVRYNPQ
jgi:hypothetical protein